VGFTPATIISRWESMGMERYHHLSVLRLIEHGGTMEGKVGGMQEATAAGITTIKSGAPGTTTITIPVLRHVETKGLTSCMEATILGRE
jgi:hypothetical protein